jgi:hypothetical protein
MSGLTTEIERKNIFLHTTRQHLPSEMVSSFERVIVDMHEIHFRRPIMAFFNIHSLVAVAGVQQHFLSSKLRHRKSVSSITMVSIDQTSKISNSYQSVTRSSKVTRAIV